MDISFLLATNRESKYGQTVIDSINNIDTNFEYEICVYSPNKYSGKNIRHFQEKDSLGSIIAYNEMIKEINSKYFYLLIDDHIVSMNIYNVISFLESYYFDNKRFKICTLSPGVNNYARIPIKNENWCGGITIDYDVDSYTTMRFPVGKVETVKNELGGYLFHPCFRIHGADLWLGYYMGINGECGIQYEGSNLTQYINLRHWSNEQDDCSKYHNLVLKHRNGYANYV